MVTSGASRPGARAGTAVRTATHARSSSSTPRSTSRPSATTCARPGTAPGALSAPSHTWTRASGWPATGAAETLPSPVSPRPPAGSPDTQSGESHLPAAARRPVSRTASRPDSQSGPAQRCEGSGPPWQFQPSPQQRPLSHLAVLAVGHPLAPSMSSSLASSLASSTGSGGSSPTALPTLSARTHPLDPTSSAGEGVPGSTLDLHLGDISLVSPDKDLEEHDGCDLGPAGQRSLGGSAPVAIPGCLPRSPSLHSSSSLSASPLGSFSQSLPGPLISSAMTPPQQPPPLTSEPRALGPSVSSYNSFGLNGVPGSIWDFVSGSFSPSPSPILNAGPAASSGVNPSSAELARVRRQLDEAKRKIRQWEESWQQVKQACDAWQREAKEAKERALAADSARQLALQKKEEVEAQFRRLQEELEGRGLASALPGLSGCGDIGAIPLPKLHSLQSQLRLDLEAVDGVIFQLRAKQCVMCGERAGAVLRPCQHRVLCEPCAGSAPECAYCTGQPLPW
ncbi:putative E3 ubiquitin-protein ligase UNKL isoform X3 [Ovis aries]|uniref:putative E3 ubiquitin-protein ligase UNKL isoform X3 n=1 Tax=Ovis aries TaxID=9940 RepID=UPI002952800E|nr:putative E3 ubiquitin-protein ligase UNKL isoform X3 [Ovis aries]